MKKPKTKLQDFTLPLIEQKQKNSHQVSKSNSKRTKKLPNDSNLNTKRKQKEQSRPSALRKQFNQIQKNINQQKHKSKSLKKQEIHSQTERDFEEKIKQNKRLLQNHKIKKQVQLKLKYYGNQNTQKQNIESTLKLPILNPISMKKSSIQLLKKINNQELKNTNNPSMNLKRSLSNNHRESKNNKNNRSLIDQKNCSDIFEDIHNFLQSVNHSQSFNHSKSKPNILKADKIYQKLQKYKQKLKKIDPNQSLIDLNKIQSYQSLKLHSQTVSQWKKINISQKYMEKINTSFREQLQKIGIYLTRTSVTLDQLLQHRKQILDLGLLKKLKQKNSQKILINKKRISQFADQQYS